MWIRLGILILAWLAPAVMAEPSEQNSRRNASRGDMVLFEQRGYLVVRPAPASPGGQRPDAGFQVLLSPWPRGEAERGEYRGPDLLLAEGQHLWPRILAYARAYGPETLVRIGGYRFSSVDTLWRVQSVYAEDGARGVTGLRVFDAKAQRIPWTIRFGLPTRACGPYPRLTVKQGPTITADGRGRVDVWVEISDPVPHQCQVLESRVVDAVLDLRQFGTRPG